MERRDCGLHYNPIIFDAAAVVAVVAFVVLSLSTSSATLRLKTFESNTADAFPAISSECVEKRKSAVNQKKMHGSVKR